MKTAVNATITPVDRARAYVSQIPGAVAGAHGDCQTLVVANVLVWDFGLTGSEALPILREYNARCSPPWTEAALRGKLQSAERQPHQKPRGHLLGATWRPSLPSADAPDRKGRTKQIDPATATENWLKGFRADEVDTWEASPIRPPNDYRKDAICLLENLYKPGELINFVTDFDLDAGKARPKGKGETVERDALLARWRRRGMPRSEAGGWLRMNPLDGRGVADSNVTVHRFALVECDAIPLGLQLSLIVRLPLPIALITTSARRSFHGWVRIDAESADEYRETVIEMLALLGKFGVDSSNKNPSRLSRLPGVVRRIGAEGDGKQRLLYLNPHPVQKAILS